MVVADAFQFMFTAISLHFVGYSLNDLEGFSLPNLENQMIYVYQCIKMVEVFLQWPQLELFSERPVESTYQQLTQLVINLFKELIITAELQSSKAKYHSNKNKRHSNQLKVENLKHQVLVFQAICVYWYLVFEISTTYYIKIGRNSMSDLADFFPFNLELIFGCSFKKLSNFRDNSVGTLLRNLFQLWSIRDHKLSPLTYTFGNSDLDDVDKKIRPFYQYDGINYSIFECLLRIDFIISGLICDCAEIKWVANFFENYRGVWITNSLVPIQSSLNVEFYRWIIIPYLVFATCGVEFDVKKLKSNILMDKLKDFVTNLRLFYPKLSNNNNKIQSCDFCTFVPTNKESIVFIVAKCLSLWLYNIGCFKNNLKSIEASCLACVFLQVNEWSKNMYIDSSQLSTSYTSISNIIYTNWTDVRNKFLHWITTYGIVFDACLLGMLADIEHHFETQGNSW